MSEFDWRAFDRMVDEAVKDMSRLRRPHPEDVFDPIEDEEDECPT